VQEGVAVVVLVVQEDLAGDPAAVDLAAEEPVVEAAVQEDPGVDLAADLVAEVTDNYHWHKPQSQ